MYEGSSSHYILHWLVQKRKKKKLGLLHFLALWWSTSMLVYFTSHDLHQDEKRICCYKLSKFTKLQPFSPKMILLSFCEFA